MAGSEPAPPSSLRLMSQPPTLAEYVGDIWQRRQFTWSLATGSLRGKYLDTALGNVWHVLNPTLLMATYYLIFGVVLQTSRGLENFIGFLAIGVFTYRFSQRTVMSGGQSITNNLNLIRSFQFPRAVLPIAAVLEQMTGYLFSSFVIIAILLLTGEPLAVSWLMAVPLLLLMMLFSVGLGLVVARLTDSVRDVANVLPFLFRIVFYMSGIIFWLEAFITDSALDKIGLENVSGATARRVFALNPFFSYIDLLRDSMMESYTAENPDVAWVTALVAAPVAFVFGLVYFRGAERRYGRG